MKVLTVFIFVIAAAATATASYNEWPIQVRGDSVTKPVDATKAFAATGHAELTQLRLTQDFLDAIDYSSLCPGIQPKCYVLLMFEQLEQSVAIYQDERGIPRLGYWSRPSSDVSSGSNKHESEPFANDDEPLPCEEGGATTYTVTEIVYCHCQTKEGQQQMDMTMVTITYDCAVNEIHRTSPKTETETVPLEARCFCPFGLGL